uniref:Uncharacterized protein n=1 Tax=Rhipicephalus zambeziensis TaxID=60191 RepID=A0A224YH58_9ACAR
MLASRVQRSPERRGGQTLQSARSMFQQSNHGMPACDLTKGHVQNTRPARLSRSSTPGAMMAMAMARQCSQELAVTRTVVEPSLSSRPAYVR